MSNFRDFYKALEGDVPKLSEPKAKQIINEALSQIYDSHLWHFLIEQSYIIIPNQLTTGTLAFVRGSRGVTPSVAAKAALDSFGLLPPLTDCQVRIGNGQPYEIASYDNAASSDNITLSQPYLDTSNPTATYSIYRAYFSPPFSTDSSGSPIFDFLRFKIIHNRVPGNRPLTLVTQDWINKRNPQRNSGAEPYAYAPFSNRASDGVPLYEFEPPPTVSRNLFCIYQKRGQALVNDRDTIPSPLTTQLLMKLARYNAYEWADSHKGEFKAELASVNWQRKMSDIMYGQGIGQVRDRGTYPHLLGLAIKQDREIFSGSQLGSYYNEIYGVGYPGGSYLQNHAFAGGYSNL